MDTPIEQAKAVDISEKTLNRHDAYYETTRQTEVEARVTSPGNQQVLQLLRGGHLGDDFRDGQGRRALDMGFGSGFNCVSLARLGWDVCGCEITQNIVDRATLNLKDYGCKADLRVGENERIPFPDNHVDLLLSVNVIHYVDSRSGVEETIREYARVLRPGGVLLLFSTHPGNWLLKGAETIDSNLTRVKISDDYRRDQTLFVFQNKEEISKAFSAHFNHVQVGENQLDYFNKTLRNWILTARGKEDE